MTLYDLWFDFQEIKADQENCENFDLPLEDISPEREEAEEDIEDPVDPYTDFVPPEATEEPFVSPVRSKPKKEKKKKKKKDKKPSRKRRSQEVKSFLYLISILWCLRKLLNCWINSSLVVS